MILNVAFNLLNCFESVKLFNYVCFLNAHFVCKLIFYQCHVNYVVFDYKNLQVRNIPDYSLRIYKEWTLLSRIVILLQGTMLIFILSSLHIGWLLTIWQKIILLTVVYQYLFTINSRNVPLDKRRITAA